MDEHEKFTKMVEERKKLLAENKRLQSRNRLNENMRKRVETTMIGALAIFEDYFGEMWGQGKKPNELDRDEAYYKGQWEQVRTEILNKGNKQIRICEEELSEYTVEWNKYNTQFNLGFKGK
jgi:hypothetical protein